MSRRLRVDFPGAIHHVMNRGDRGEAIFRDEEDRNRFLATLEEACAKTDWQIFAYSLLQDRFHVVLESSRGNLVHGMKWFLGTYTSRFNQRHQTCGHLFAGRYKSQLIGPTGGFLATTAEYVHLTPAWAGLISSNQRLREFVWSSFPSYLGSRAQRPAWLAMDRVWSDGAVPRNTPDAGNLLEEKTEALRNRDNEDFQEFHQRWYFGDDRFRQTVLQHVPERRGTWQYGPEFKELAIEKAERIIDNELKRAGWTESHLVQRRKGDPIKVRIARTLRQQTTVTIPWIADRLGMGTKDHLVHLLYWQDKPKSASASANIALEPHQGKESGGAKSLLLETHPGNHAAKADAALDEPSPAAWSESKIMEFDVTFD